MNDKRYEDTLERAREIYANPREALKDNVNLTNEGSVAAIKVALLDLFPMEVLAESEDERIRKELIQFLNHYHTGQGEYVSFDKDWISWLEKKKENPKSTDSIPSNCVSNAKSEGRWHKVQDSIPDDGREVLAKDNLGNVLLARFDGEGWDVSVYDNEDYRCHNGIANWCEIPSEKQKEQQPDIELIQRSWYMEGYFDGEFKREPKWILKTGEGGPRHELSPRYGELLPDPKPAEWSEEDETMWQNLVGWMEGSFGILQQGKQRYINWLKERFVKLVYPQPHWKPSREQMEAFESAMKLYKDTHFECFHPRIDSLYNDLQKLL